MQSEWQVDFFRGVALDMWRRAVSAEQTRARVRTYGFSMSRAATAGM